MENIKGELVFLNLFFHIFIFNRFKVSILFRTLFMYLLFIRAIKSINCLKICLVICILVISLIHLFIWTITCLQMTNYSHTRYNQFTCSSEPESVWTDSSELESVWTDSSEPESVWTGSSEPESVWTGSARS